MRPERNNALKNIIRSAAAIILTAVLMLAFCGCGASKMTDAEAVGILAELIPLSQELNAVLWGDALPLEDENPEAVRTVTAAQYYPVSAESRYQTVEQVKADCEKVFSSDYLEDVYPMIFDGYTYEDENGNKVEVEPRYRNDDRGVIARDITSLSYTFGTEIDTSSAHVEETGEGIVRVSVKCTVNGEQSEMKITLRLQGEKWLLDSPTY